jgi:tetratricopeptide (TPR) repeat protein
MASNVPTIKQIEWTFFIPHIILIVILGYLYQFLDIKKPFTVGALTYYILSLVLKNIIAKDHRQGMRLVKQQKFTEAISCFEKSVEFFSQNKWIDKYRYLVLLSVSKLTYYEMGLCNIAFCYSQTGNGIRAKEFYQKTLKEYPNNGLAIAGLNMLSSFENKTQAENSI